MWPKQPEVGVCVTCLVGKADGIGDKDHTSLLVVGGRELRSTRDIFPENSAFPMLLTGKEELLGFPQPLGREG